MAGGDSTEDPYSQLSARERELLRLLGRGMALAEIARHAGLSVETMVSCCELIREKLGLASRHELQAYALKRLVAGGETVTSMGHTGQLPLPFGSDKDAE